MDNRKYNSQDITSKLDEIKEVIKSGGTSKTIYVPCDLITTYQSDSN